MKNIRLFFELLWFMRLMFREIKANEHKGDWRTFNDRERQISELDWHRDKLVNAMYTTNTQSTLEHSADVANAALFIAYSSAQAGKGSDNG
ncbi:MAG: hypothetical protein KAJ07_04695 [Planctomycetes bacterium]|nr:hypothetical protein [Planctomycetota bacterium]